MNQRAHLRLALDVQQSIVEAVRDPSRIDGLTHGFYRYPARFSPQLVRSVIDALSDPGDWILDPFMGGGTTLVESLASGRNAIGTDISSLATFVSQVKTTLYTDDELDAIRAWARRTSKRIDMKAVLKESNSAVGYQRNLKARTTWRLRKAVAQCVHYAARLKTERLENLARCVVLRTSQWALDGRRKPPTIEMFRNQLLLDAELICSGASKLTAGVVTDPAADSVRIHCLNRSVAGLHEDTLVKSLVRPKLVLTSPPYPGVHVLYHRWQVDGRKESAAPFWIVNRADGSGAAYYTMGDRKAAELNTYFENLHRALDAVAKLCTKSTTIVQVVAFSQPDWQLPRYLSVADDSGLKEYFLPALAGEADGRLWRSVPNRKWHADLNGKTSGSIEVVLFHKLA